MTQDIDLLNTLISEYEQNKITIDDSFVLIKMLVVENEVLAKQITALHDEVNAVDEFYMEVDEHQRAWLTQNNKAPN